MFLISFEGLDGCGKTSAVRALQDHVTRRYPDQTFVFTREPGGTGVAAAEAVRTLILSQQAEIDPLAEALLYLSARQLHINQLIRPALRARKIVVCDRYVDSSIAYQGGGRQLGMATIAQLNRMIVGDLMPRYTFYLQLDWATAQARMQAQGRTTDRLEAEDPAFFTRVSASYEELSRQEPQRFITIDARRPQAVVLAEVIAIFDKIISTEINKD